MPLAPSPADDRMPLRTRWLLLAGAVLPIGAVVGLIAFTLLQGLQQAEDRAAQTARNLAAALENTVAARVSQVDTALVSLVDDLEANAPQARQDAAVLAEMAAQRRRRPEVLGLDITDARGRTLYSHNPLSGMPGRADSGPAAAADWADLPWFGALRADAELNATASPRIELLRTPERWLVVVVRAWHLPNGRFGGAVVASLPLAFFENQLSTAREGLDSMVLLDDELRLIARAPEVGHELIGTRDVPDAMQAFYASGDLQASFKATGNLDGVTRSYSYRRLALLPLVVKVGLSERDYLADWHRERRLMVGFTAFAVLLHAAGVLLLWRQLASNRRARQRIELLAKAFEHSGEAIMLTDADCRILEVNPAFVRQTGYSPHEAQGMPLALLDNRHGDGIDLREVQRSIANTGVWRGEVWDRTREGRHYPKWLSISAVRDALGRITHHIANATDISAAKQAEERIRHLAHHDHLTQLPNRKNLEGRLEQALAAARREGSEVAMLFIDMDRFKQINDTLGHPVGDALLVEVGRRLRTLVRECDIVSRLGGDEFVVVLTGVGQDGARAAAAVAGKVRESLSQPYPVGTHQLHSSPSIGVALFPVDGQDPETLMKNADAAMYHAKANGRNNFQFFTAAMNHATQERLAIEAGLRTAIERGELFLHYQPQLHLASQRLTGFEALVRWRSAELGLVPPLKFIPVAEETGQIEAIGEWVLAEALRQVAVWRQQGQGDLQVAVNLSARQLRDQHIVDRVQQALQQHGLPGAALELEITESVAMADPARTRELLHRLRGLGVSLAIDDFGTGHSSLAYLKQLPLTCLKLDRSFVMDIEKDANDAAICTAAIQLAHSLGLAVVGEGVETALQLEFLRRLGCDTVQGYFISKPLGAEDAGTFVARFQPDILPSVDPSALVAA